MHEQNRESLIQRGGVEKRGCPLFFSFFFEAFLGIVKKAFLNFSSGTLAKAFIWKCICISVKTTDPAGTITRQSP